MYHVNKALYLFVLCLLMCTCTNKMHMTIPTVIYISVDYILPLRHLRADTNQFHVECSDIITILFPPCCQPLTFELSCFPRILGNVVHLTLRSNIFYSILDTLSKFARTGVNDIHM